MVGVLSSPRSGRRLDWILTVAISSGLLSAYVAHYNFARPHRGGLEVPVAPYGQRAA